MKSLVTAFLAVIVISFLFLSFPNNSNAQPTFPPTFPPTSSGCCQYIGTGIENQGQDVCVNLEGFFSCPLLVDTNFVGFEQNQVCNQSSGRCEFPRNVPTLSEYGLIAMAFVMGLLGFILLRRKKATA